VAARDLRTSLEYFRAECEYNAAKELPSPSRSQPEQPAMTLTRRLLAVPIILTVTSGLCAAAEIRDGAGLFSARAIAQAQATLERAEKSSGKSVFIETIPSLEGRNVDAVADENARMHRSSAVYVLFAKNDKKFRFREPGQKLYKEQESEISSAFLDSLKAQDFDGALTRGSSAIASALTSVPANRGGGAVAGRRNQAPAANRGAGGAMGGWGFILTIGLVILAVMFGLRILGAMFGAGRGMGAPGMRPGMGGPGYGGGGGGGFMSSMLGGIGGAMAGNWIYDQFRGRDHGSYGGGAGSDPGVSEPDGVGGGGGDWGGDGGAGGGGGDWGGGGGGDWGGGGGGGGDWS
jgi:uncharacterized protein